MKRSIEDTSIVLIGAGNLATNLGKALYAKGFLIKQVFSRTAESASTLARQLEADYTTSLADIDPYARLYITSLSDEAFASRIDEIVGDRRQGLWVHTAGSLPMNLWQGKVEHYGVFYPMQTFSKQREVDFKNVPIFIEASSTEDATFLQEVAAVLSEQVYEATSEQRKCLHLAAVFTCNFTNHMYALAEELLQHYHLPFEAMLPLIDETARKVHTLSPSVAQTGPAVRNDSHVMEHHLSMLADRPDLQNIYRLLSESIRQRHHS